MNVAQLITELQKLPQDAQVYLGDYEEDYGGASFAPARATKGCVQKWGRRVLLSPRSAPAPEPAMPSHLPPPQPLPEPEVGTPRWWMQQLWNLPIDEPWTHMQEFTLANTEAR